MKKITTMFRVSLALVLIINLTGCLTVPTLADRKASIATAQDPEMSSAIFSAAETDPTFRPISSNFTGEWINVRQYIKTTSSSLSGALSEYGEKDSSKDAFADAYIKTAKGRGNTVRLYNYSINQKVRSLYKIDRPLPNGTNVTNIDNALAEYDKNNRLVTIMVRSHMFSPPLGLFSNQNYTTVYTGQKAARIESTISSKDFSENLITEL